MRISDRIKKLEKKMEINKDIWAVFTIGYYEDEQKQKAAQGRLLASHLAEGYPRPNICLFVNEIPGETSAHQQEVFLYSF